MASRMLDLPLPFKPVIELNDSSLVRSSQCHISRANVKHRQQLAESNADIGLSKATDTDGTYHPETTVRAAYDLKPCQQSISEPALSDPSARQITAENSHQ